MKNNKTYKQMYDELIQFRQKNIIPQDQLGENHHIKPKSLFPELINDKNNIVRLTLKEHFLAHYYLWKYFKHETSNSEANSKMCCAVIRMTPQFKSILKNEVNNDLINKISEYYEEARIEAIELLKELSKAFNELPEGDTRRANILSDIGGKFYHVMQKCITRMNLIAGNALEPCTTIQGKTTI